MDTFADDHNKLFCKCNACGGQFFVPSDKADKRLICPHCKQEASEYQTIEHIEEDGARTSNQSDIPPSPKKAFIPKRKVPSVTTTTPKLEPALPITEEYLKNVEERHSGKKTGGCGVLLLFLIAFLSLGVASIFYYKTSHLPDITRIGNKQTSLLVDTEHENDPYKDQLLIIEPDIPERSSDKDHTKDRSMDLKSSGVVSTEELHEIMQTIQAYFSAKSMDERLKYVFDPEMTRKDMEVYESGQMSNPNEDKKPLQIEYATLNNEGVVSAEIFFTDQTSAPFYFVFDQQTKKWFIDWYSLVQFQSVPYDEIIKNQLRNPVEVRVLISAGVHYEPPFTEQADSKNYLGKSYLNITLTFKDGRILHGYVDRHSEMFTDILKNLATGSKNATLLITSPLNSIPGSDQVIITEVLRFNWLGEHAAAKAKENKQAFSIH